MDGLSSFLGAQFLDFGTAGGPLVKQVDQLVVVM